MVDFNNDATIATPAIDIVRVEILERRYNVGEAIEQVLKIESSDYRDIRMLKARVKLYFLCIKPTIRRCLTDEEYELLEDKLDAGSVDEIIEAFMTINSVLDEIGFTKIDNKKKYDKTNPEAENEAFGL